MRKSIDVYRGPPRLFALGVVLWVVGLALPASLTTLAPTPPTRPSLLVIGDSIVVGTYDNIAKQMPGWDVTVDAKVSRSTAQGLDVFRSHGAKFSAVVIELGANDGGEENVFRPRVAALLRATGAVPHVIWLNVHEARPYYKQTNAIIAQEVARHPNASVGDWNAAVQPADVGGDGLHLTPQGSVAMSKWIAMTVRTITTPPPTTTSSSTTSTTVPAPATTSARQATRSINANADDQTMTWFWWGTAAILCGVLTVLVILWLRLHRTQESNDGN